MQEKLENVICSPDPITNFETKAKFAEEGTFFANRFPSLTTFVIKKVGI